MQTLERLLARSAIEVLQKSEHILIGTDRLQNLLDELESLVAPTLPALRREIEDGALHAPPGDGRACDSLGELVDRIVARLMDSDHVDDIFAEDRIIRRDAFRALRDLLARDPQDLLGAKLAEHTPGATTVDLAHLGYVVATVAQRADPDELSRSLERAARRAHGALVAFDPGSHRAAFALDESSQDQRLEIEEAITDELLDLVDSERVELPGVERVLRLPDGASRARGFEHAVADAVDRAERQTGCAAACTLVDERTLLAAITPLTEEDARNADEHFAQLVAELETAVVAVQGHSRQADGSPKTRRSPARARNTPQGPAPRPTPKRATADRTKAKARAAAPTPGAPTRRRAAAATVGARSATPSHARKRYASEAPAPERNPLGDSMPPPRAGSRRKR